MALLCDYFVAPSDEQAAATIDRDGGPGAAMHTAPTQLHRRGLFHRRTEQPTAPPLAPAPVFPTVNGNGIEPLVQMGTLEELLTGRPYDDIMETNPDGITVAVREGGERLVMRLTDALTEALATASDDELVEVAVPWSQTEEFWGHGDPDHLGSFLRELAQLARTAQPRGEHLYCWLSV